MSYCRWSSMNGMCDVYVYEHCHGGWTTHVAGNRTIFPPIPAMPFSWIPDLHGEWNGETRRMTYPNRWRAVFAHVVCAVWAWFDRVHLWSSGVIPRRPIGLPHDTESFSDSTPSECADRLEALREMGYRVPQYAIDALRQEDSERHSDAPGK